MACQTGGKLTPNGKCAWPASFSIRPPPNSHPPPRPCPQTADAAAALVGPDLRPLGRDLIEDGAVGPHNLMKALVMRQRQSVRLGDILLSRGWVREDALTAPCRGNGAPRSPIWPPLPLIRGCWMRSAPTFAWPGGSCRWRRVGGVTFIATARPEFRGPARRLPAGLARCAYACSETAAREAILAQRRTALIRQAEMRVAPSRKLPDAQ